MATLAELTQARKDFKITPILFQAELYVNIPWMLNGGLKANYDKKDLEFALIKESLSAWNNNSYNVNNVFNVLADNSGAKGYIGDVFKRLIALKNNDRINIFNDSGVDNGYKAGNRGKEIYNEFNEVITQLTTDRDTAQNSLKTWTNTFTNLTAQQVKTEYDKPKEQHTDEEISRLKQAETNLNKWTSTFTIDKYPKGAESVSATIDQLTANQEKHKPEDLEKNKPENLKPSDYDQIKGELDTIKDKQKIIDENNNIYLAIIKSYQELIHPWLTELESKVKSEPLTQELLSIYRKETNYRLTVFYQEREIDDNIINQKYSQDYRTIVKQQLTLTNRRDMEEAFKVVTCICAAEKAEQMSNKLKDKNSEVLIKPLRTRLSKLKKTWEELPKTVKSENNPFYLPIIEDQSTYQAKVDQLITFWEQTKLKSVQLQPGK